MMGMEMSVRRLVEVDIEADYGNMKVWNLEFPRLCEDLESLILNRLTSCGGLSLSRSLSRSPIPSLQIKKQSERHFQYQNIRPSVAHFDGQLLSKGQRRSDILSRFTLIGHFAPQSIIRIKPIKPTSPLQVHFLSSTGRRIHIHEVVGGAEGRCRRQVSAFQPPKTSLMLMNAQKEAR